MGKLSDWANKNTPFIKLGEGESVRGIYSGAEESNYKGKPTQQYTIDGKILTSSSGKLARRLDNVNDGDEIKITRYGERENTNYEVEIIKSNKPTTEEKEAWGED